MSLWGYDSLISSLGVFFIPFRQCHSTIGDYTGASLQVNAGGDIRYGRVVIDALNPAVNPDHPVFALNAGGDIRGRGEVSAAEELPGLIVSLVSQGNIDTQRMVTRSGSISLTSTDGNIRAHGNFLTGSLMSRIPRGVLEDYAGGAIALLARENIDIVNSNLDSASRSETGNSSNGGSISLYAGSNVRALNSLLAVESSTFFLPVSGNWDSENGGDISIYAGGNIDIPESDLNAQTESLDSAGYGGTISLYAGEDINALNSNFRSFSDFDRGEEATDGGMNSLYAGNDVNLSSSYIASDSYTLSQSNSGDGGNVTVYAGGTITANKWDVFTGSTTFSGVSGDGGMISVYAEGDIRATNSTFFSVTDSAEGSGDGGNIYFHAGGTLNVSNTSFAGGTFGWKDRTFVGDGGNIFLRVGGDLTVSDLEITSTAYSRSNSGNGGDISLYVGGDIDGNMILSSLAISERGNSGNGGNISIIVPYGHIDGLEQNIELYSASVGETEANLDERQIGRGGDVYLQAGDTISNMEVLTASSLGRAGDVYIAGQTNLALSNIRVLTSQQVEISNPPFQTLTVFIGENAQPGDVVIRSAGRLSLVDSYLESNSRSQNPAGDILLESPIQITLRNTDILSNTVSTGDAGNITLSTEQLNLRNANVRAESSPENLEGVNPSGIAGDINITANSINLDTSTISVSAEGNAQAGSLNVDANQIVMLDQSGITAETEDGSGGDIQLQDVNRLTLRGDSTLSASTLGNGFGGDITLTSPDSLTITGNGSISSETSGAGDAGTITIDATDLIIQNQTQLSTVSTNIATGQGGNINLDAPNAITLTETHLLATTQSSGAAGDIEITTGQLNLNDTQIQAESIPAEGLTDRPGTAGDINITANTINLDDSTLSVSAQENAQAGSLDIHTNILNVQNQSNITAETETSNQQTGTITLHIDDDLTLSDRSSISTESQNSPAGDIRITVGDTFSATNSDITTSAQQNSGGNIRLHANDIRLYGDSDISSNSGIDGGNITLRTNSIIAFDDSDILAFAQQRGGDIRLATSVFFGEGFEAIALVD